MSEHWFHFVAFGEQARYGYGTAEEASRYEDHLNATRTINVYWSRKMADTDVLDLNLENNDLGFSLGIALSDIAETDGA